MFSMITRISESYTLYKYQNIHHANMVTHFLSIAFKGVLLYFLWRKQITDFFGVSLKTKKDTALMSSIGTVILLAFLYTLLT